MRSFILTVLLVITTACVSCQNQGSGTLAGHVSIGPLQPVVREGEPEPVPTPEMYAAWRIVVSTVDNQTDVASVAIDSQGNYEVTLSDGVYVITAVPSNGVGFGQQAYTVEIAEGATTSLDIDIDTGIR